MKGETYFRLYGVGEIPAENAALVLNRLSDAYYGLWVLDNLRWLPIRQFMVVTKKLTYDANHSVWLPEANLPRELLELKGVILQSPGFWEFIGKLNPLETIRFYLNDRHERKKDIQYRNSLEKERLLTGNKLLQVKLIAEVLETARQAGLSDGEISQLFRDNALLPLLRLESLQDSNVISYAEIAKKKNIEERVEDFV